MSSRPRLLDLFCGAGGAGAGYARAGFEVVGLDIAAQPRYPFELMRGDFRDVTPAFVEDFFDVVHASPPCQAYSKMTANKGSRAAHPDLVLEVRELLEEAGRPYVIENVPGAPLVDPVRLCGRSFGLPVRRHRLFELGHFTIPLVPPCACADPALQVNGHPGGSSTRNPRARFGNTDAWRAGMEIDWMTAAELAEAIPPAYTEFIGEHLLAAIEVRA